jgi:hypothetical protein
MLNTESLLKNTSTDRNYRDDDAKRSCLECVFGDKSDLHQLHHYRQLVEIGLSLRADK